MELESLREDLLDFCDMVHPNLDALKNNYLSIEDVIDFVIYESIKAAYDDYAPKKSLRQHMIENGLDSDADRRRFSRQIQYAQYYRDLQQERIADRTGIEIDELSGKVKRVSELITYCKSKLHETEEEVEKILKSIDD